MVSRLVMPGSPHPMICRPDPAAPQPAASGADHGRACERLVFPNLITSVATTGATVTDNQMTAAIDDDLAGKTLAPGRHYLDSGYLSAALVVSEAARHGIALIGPLLADTSAQARAGNGYARADFTIDYDRKTVPARKERHQRPGRRAPSEARTRSWPPSPPATAGPARPGPSAPPTASTSGSSPCRPAPWPPPRPPPAPR